MINKERWQGMSFYQQMGHIASELSRSIQFNKQNDMTLMRSSLWRALELIDLTTEDIKNRTRLRELCRFKEVLADWYAQTEVYSVHPETLKKYALSFAMIARK